MANPKNKTENASAEAPKNKTENASAEAPKPTKEDLLLVVAARAEAIKKAEDAVKKVRADFSSKLAPFNGMVIRHDGKLLKVVANAKNSFSLKNLETKDLVAAREAGL